MEDDSIQVNEAKQENSGIPQGTLIRRHRIPQPPPNDDEFYTVEFFNIGNAVTMYGRSFNITACDEFTRNYLTKTGIKMETPQHSEPADPYFDHRLMEASTMQPHRPYEKFDTLKQVSSIFHQNFLLTIIKSTSKHTKRKIKFLFLGF